MPYEAEDSAMTLRFAAVEYARVLEEIDDPERASWEPAPDISAAWDRLRKAAMRYREGPRRKPGCPRGTKMRKRKLRARGIPNS